MDGIFEVLKRVLVAILLITVVNIVMDTITIPYTLFNIGFVTAFSLPGMVVLLFIIYYIK